MKRWVVSSSYGNKINKILIRSFDKKEEAYRFADDDDDGEDEDEEKEKDGADDAQDEADFGIFEEVLGGDDRRGDAFSL